MAADNLFPQNSRVFEEEIRRLARQMWPESGGDSPVIFDGRERDGVFITSDTIHLLEATTDPKKVKAEKDIQKSIDLKKKLTSQSSYEAKNFKIWFVTRSDPTADQAEVAKQLQKKSKCPIVAISGKNFQNHLVNVGDYLSARQNYRFGSVRNLDPSKSNRPVSDAEFVALDMLSISDNQPWSTTQLVHDIKDTSGMYVLLGEYGAGKSMTMRHIFQQLKDEYLNGRDIRFPVFLNLSDHVGQDDPASAIYDHATKVGFPQPDTLVRAWRAGFVHLLLDGFDEMASSRFRAGSRGLRVARSKAMTLVREFSGSHPAENSALVVSGRQNYFDSNQERIEALGLRRKKYLELTLNEFNADQVQEYIKKLNIESEVIPDWLPSRPLLIGYLARHQIISSTSKLISLSRASGWDYLLDLICEREASQIEAIGGAVSTVRNFVERLATRCRQTLSGRGPIPVGEMTQIFEHLVPATADDAAEQLLLRMAGLAASASDGGSAVVAGPPDQLESREFVDDDLVDVARAGDVIRFIRNSHDNYLNEIFKNPDSTFIMDELGVEVSVNKLSEINVTARQCSAALFVANKDLKANALSMDIIRIMQELSFNIVDVGRTEKEIIISGVDIEKYECSDSIDFENVIFSDCLFGELSIEGDNKKLRGPRFLSCIIGELVGASSRDDVPKNIIDDNCEIDKFRNAADVSADIRQLPLSPPERVLLVSLRKLFQQRGKGRKESAFHRGLDGNERAYVNEVLNEILSHGFAVPYPIGGNTIWMPNRNKRTEAMRILSAPQMSKAPIFKAVKNLAK